MTANRFQPLVSTGTRFAAAFAVAAIVATACIAAGNESRSAVQGASAAMSSTLYVTLPTVEIVGQREAAATTALASL